MLSAISPQGYVFIVGGLFFVCSVAFVLLAAASVTKARWRANRRLRAAQSASGAEPPHKALGGVPASDRWPV